MYFTQFVVWQLLPNAYSVSSDSCRLEEAFILCSVTARQFCVKLCWRNHSMQTNSDKRVPIILNCINIYLLLVSKLESNDKPDLGCSNGIHIGISRPQKRVVFIHLLSGSQ
jgi:hypothetical protein